MADRQKLPMEVHDHFRKANVLHGYVENNLSEASKHALETGQELLVAKKAIPHGRWEDECERLFDGSPRTAQFYMAFARDFGKLKSAQKAALLMLEGTLDGAAKAAKKAVSPKPPPPKPKPEPDDPIDVDSEPVDTHTKEDEDPADAPLPDDPEEESIEDIVDTHNKAIESFCRGVRAVAKQQPEVAWLDHKGRWEGYFRKVCQGLDTLRCAKAVVCPACVGEGCKECDDLGFLPKMDAEGISV